MLPISLSAATYLLLSSWLIEPIAGSRVVPMEFHRREDARTLEKIKRDVVDVTLFNAQRGSRGVGIYYVNTTIGTPPQTLQLQLDTGSSDLWMFSAEACESDDIMCFGGIYTPDESKTYNLLFSGEFNISYVTAGSGVHGDYISDDISIGGVTVKGLTMGLAKEAKQVPTGIMGIGYRENEAIYAQTGGKQSYPNLVDLMVNQSLINTRSYSLYLDDMESATGTILFGGYDTEKFDGTLALLDIQPDENGEITSFIVAWTGFSVTSAEGDLPLTSDGFAQPVYLDSGTTLTVLPESIAEQLIQAAEAVYDEGSDIYLLPCAKANADAWLNYQFGGKNGPTIRVPFKELVLPIRDGNGDFVEIDGEQYCLFGIKPGADDDILLFGDTFLRSAYVVYDLDGQTIGLAQAIIGTEKSNIIEITGPVADGLQGASSVAAQATAQATATSRNAGIGGGPISSVQSTAFITPTAQSTPGFTFGGGNNDGSGSEPSNTGSSQSQTPNGAIGAVPAFDWTSCMVVIGSMLMTVLGGGVFGLL